MRVFSYCVFCFSTCHPLLMQVALRGRLLKCSNLPRRIFRGSLPPQSPVPHEVTEHGFFLCPSRAVDWPRSGHTRLMGDPFLTLQSGMAGARFARLPVIRPVPAVGDPHLLCGSHPWFPQGLEGVP